MLRFLAKTFVEQEPVLLAGIEELANGFHLHLFPDGGDLFGAEAFYFEHFDHARGGLMDILLKEPQFAGLLYLLYFFADGVPDALYGYYLFEWKAFERSGKLFEGEGRDRIRFRFEGVFAVDIH